MVHAAEIQMEHVLRARPVPGVLFVLLIVAHLTYSVDKVVEICSHFKRPAMSLCPNQNTVPVTKPPVYQSRFVCECVSVCLFTCLSLCFCDCAGSCACACSCACSCSCSGFLHTNTHAHPGRSPSSSAWVALQGV